MCEIDHCEINLTSVNRFMIIFMSSQTELHADKSAVSFIKVVVSTIPYFWQRLACRGVCVGGGGKMGMFVKM